MEGAAGLVSFAVLFAYMGRLRTADLSRALPVASVVTALAAAAALAVAGKAADVPLAGALALALVYPVVLLPLGFYLPVERTRLALAIRRTAR